jgi:hypothetical protein
MPVDVRITFNKKDLDLSGFSKAQIEKASYRAINNALKQARTAGAREISQNYNIPYAYAQKGFFILKSGRNLHGELLSSRTTIPIRSLDPVEVREGVKTKFVGSRKKGGWASAKTRDKVVGLTFTMKKGTRTTLRDAFLDFTKGIGRAMAYGKYSTDKFVFDPDHTKKSELFTASVHGMLSTSPLQRKLQDKAVEAYEREYYSLIKNLARMS